MNFDLRKSTILLIVGGSRAYGIHTDTSDVDVKGVAVPPRDYFLGYLQNFDQADKQSQMEVFIDTMNAEELAAIKREKIEGSVYNLVKFAKLAADANPNILDVLFCREEEVRIASPLGRKLRENRDMFLSAKAKHTFSGYAAAQLKRIKGHRKWLLDPPKAQPTRDEFGLPEFTLIPKDHLAAAQASVRKQVDRWEIDWSTMLDSEKVYVTGQVAEFLGEISAALGGPGDRAALQEALKTLQAEVGSNYQSGPDVESAAHSAIATIEHALSAGKDSTVEDAKWLAAARVVGLDENLIYVMQKEREYEGARRHWKQYKQWEKSRNPARAALEAAHGYDTKHGAHLVRLLRMGREIMESGEVHVWRGAGSGPNDREELLAIRGGSWDYDSLIEWSEAEDRALHDLYKQKKYVVRGAPDRKGIDKLIVGMVEDALSMGVPDAEAG